MSLLCHGVPDVDCGEVVKRIALDSFRCSLPWKLILESDAGSVPGRIDVLVVHSIGTSFRFKPEWVQSGVEQLLFERLDEGRIVEKWL